MQTVKTYLAENKKPLVIVAGAIGIGLTLSFTAIASISNDSWVDEKGARETIQQYGLEPVTVGGYDPDACEGGQYYHTKFTAIGRGDKPVQGVVCRSPWHDRISIELK